MSGLRYTVAIQCAIVGGDWEDHAAFRWFVDAKHHAIRISKGDKLDRFVRISFEDEREPFYFRGGLTADHIFEEAA